MTPSLEVCATVLQHGFPESLSNHLESGIIVALGTASFVVGTLLRRTAADETKLAAPQPYSAAKKKNSPLDQPHGRISSSADAAVPQSNPNAA